MKELSAGKETFISRLADRFPSFADGLERTYAVTLHLAHIMSRRWEYLSGRMPGSESDYGSYRIPLTDELGVIVYGWHRLAADLQVEVAEACRQWLDGSKAMSKEEVVAHLKSDDPRALLQEADRVRQAFCGNAVHLRGLIEFSNHCQRDCLYCGLRRSNQKLPRYRMSVEEIFESAKQAGQLGYKTIVMQSGVDGFYRIEVLCDLLKKIKDEVDCAVTLCIGERSFEDYRKLREAGADRYLLRFETSDKELFEKLKPDSSYGQRRLCLDWLKELGYQVGSGNMIGLPGQTLEILAEDILLLRDLDLDMIGIGPFIAHPETPLAGQPNGTMELTIKAVALIRIMTQNALIPATTAMGSIEPEGRQKALRAGANVIMPNVTPPKYRRYYQIYPHKICIDERPDDCAACVRALAGSVGRTIAKDYGHSFKKMRAS